MARRNKAKYNKYMNSYMKDRYKRRRAEAIESLGGECIECGSVDDLEFDHIKPHEKEITIAKASSFSEERWQAEISKCQLLCHTCHVAKHASKATCGTVQRYWRGCRCPKCRDALTKYSREKRQRRSTT